MKKLILQSFILITIVQSSFAQFQDIDPEFIPIYVTPIYDSSGPSINLGKFDDGLSSDSEKQFIDCVFEMKDSISELSIEEMYVAAIELYNRGFKDDSVYWFYKAQLRSRIFGSLLDETKIGGMGSPAFEYMGFQNSFFQLAGPFINGYAFRDPKALVKIVFKVKEEGKESIDLRRIYPDVDFKSQHEDTKVREEIITGLEDYIEHLKTQTNSILEQRKETGADKSFGKLTSKKLIID